MPMDMEMSFKLGSGGNTQKVTVSTSSASTTALTKGGIVNVLASVQVFMRKGPGDQTVTAVVDTDQPIPANVLYRVEVGKGDKIAFVAGGAGSVWVTQEV